MAGKVGYKQLPSQSPDDFVNSDLERDCYFPSHDQATAGVRSSRWALIASVLLNVALGLALLRVLDVGHVLPEPDKSLYAGLTYNSSMTFTWSSDWSNGTDHGRDALWLNENYTAPGMVALDSKNAAENGALPSVAFPWDETKGLYIVNAYHSLHCLQLIYKDISEYRQGITEEAHFSQYSHIIHCLDALRKDTMCAADDTPLYLNVTGLYTGDRQPRRCRDWSQLERWVEENESCYKRLAKEGPEVPEIERFKYCSKTSKYLPSVREAFGFGDDWYPSK